MLIEIEMKDECGQRKTGETKFRGIKEVDIGNWTIRRELMEMGGC